jgi:hypothetical protein
VYLPDGFVYTGFRGLSNLESPSSASLHYRIALAVVSSSRHCFCTLFWYQLILPLLILIAMSDAALIDFLTPRIVHAVKTDLTASVGIKANWSKESSVRSCFEALQISWPENLLETLSAPSPPSLDFWRSLPGVYNIGDLKDRWVKYAVLLEHPDKGPLVYFGIAAGGRTGADPRIKQYKTGKGSSAYGRRPKGFD